MTEGLNARQLWHLLRKHPEFSFGVVMLQHDWPRGSQPIGYNMYDIEEELVKEASVLMDAYTEPYRRRSHVPPNET